MVFLLKHMKNKWHLVQPGDDEGSDGGDGGGEDEAET
jgi:hypothetical protein